MIPKNKQPKMVYMTVINTQESILAEANHNERTAVARLHYKQASQPVVDELRQLGYEIEHIHELKMYYKTYKTAIPILLKWLPEISHVDLKEALQVKETIVQVLNNKCAKPDAIRPLIHEFENFRKVEGVNDYLNQSYLFNIANTLSGISVDSMADDLFRLVRDKKYSGSRSPFFLGLSKLKDSRTVDVLIEFLINDDLPDCAINALGKLRAVKARPYIEKYLQHEQSYTRQQARKALQRIDKL